MKLRSSKRWPLLVFALACAAIATFARFPDAVPGGAIVMQKLRGKSTVGDRLAQYGSTARERWRPFFERAGLPYPPPKLLFAAFKQERRLDVYGVGAGGRWRFVRSMPILTSSGKSGPKLRFGDGQVPEGFYRIESLNPNSAFHLALRVNYPNDFDRAQAAREGRTELGSDIMIHGSNASIGCLAMGDEGAEDLFALAAEAGHENIEVWLCPLDFRIGKAPSAATAPAWTRDLYRRLSEDVRALPAPTASSTSPNSVPAQRK